MTFVPLKADEKSRHREIRWVSLAGKPSLKKMTSEDACLAQVQSIVAGETPDLQDLWFRDPDSFYRVNFAPELDSGKKFGTGTNLQRMSLNGWNMGWMLKNS